MYYLKIKFSLSTIDNSGLFNIDQQDTRTKLHRQATNE